MFKTNASAARTAAAALFNPAPDPDLATALAPEQIAREELRREIAPVKATRSTVAEATETQARAYTPRTSILASDALRRRAEAIGPVFFAQLVNEWEAAAQNKSRKPNEGTAAHILGEYIEEPRDDGNGTFRRASTPYTFLSTLAAKVARGEIFTEDVDFNNVVQKGGRLYEHLFNAARFVRNQIEKGAVPSTALDVDVRAALNS